MLVFDVDYFCCLRDINNMYEPILDDLIHEPIIITRPTPNEGGILVSAKLWISAGQAKKLTPPNVRNVL